MVLEVTLVAGMGTVGVDGGGGAAPIGVTELSVSWPPGTPDESCSGQCLAQALARRWVGYSFSVSGRPLSTLQAGQPPLVNGAVVVAWPLRGGQLPDAPAGTAVAARATRPGGTFPGAMPVPGFEGIAAVLTVCSGPDAGAVFALRRGTFSVGRGQCRIAVADPALSRQHGTLVVGTHSITLSATRHSAGFTLRRTGASPTVSAAPVKGTVAIDVGDSVGCGNSTFELHFLDHSRGGRVDPGSAGSTGGTGPQDSAEPFAPSRSGPPLLSAATLEPLVVQGTAGSLRNQTAMMVGGCLPLVLGVVLAVVTGSWMFLAFAAMGALAVLFPLLGGGKRRQAFLAAVDEAAQHDAERISHAFPDAGTLLLAAHTGAISPRASPPDAGSPDAGLALRMGTAARAAHLVLAPTDPTFSAPLLSQAPVCVRWGPGALTVQGPANALRSLLNFVLMQLDAAAVPVVLLGDPEQLPLAARFLPHTVLVGTVPAAQHALNRLSGTVVHGGPGPAGVLVVLAERAVRLPSPLPGLRVLNFVASGNGGLSHAATGSNIADEGHDDVLPAEPGRLANTGTGLVTLVAVGNGVVGTFAEEHFVPDGVQPRAFDAYARARANTAAGLGPSPRTSLAASSLPRHCSVNALLDAWRFAAGGPLRPIPLGQSGTGPTMFDFVRDGPHLLVAGTTGSGKSEFLRVLTGSLAAAHSPEDLQFIFIDFKGGAGLGALAKLPHTSALITDLGAQGMERMLASLRAELRHREAALAHAEASDSDQYRAMARARPAQRATGPAGTGVAGTEVAVVAPPHAERSAPNSHSMAHLVVIIDEFRVLVDQHPLALAELMRIAAVGRSLGIHLVMATQRPQGALNADIRANVTSSICLRVQSAVDSADVIGTGAAATISVSTPGRGFISRAGEPAEEFQSATLRSPELLGAQVPLVDVFTERLRTGTAVESIVSSPASDPDAVAQLLREAWQAGRAADAALCEAPAVVAPELPGALTLAGTPEGDHGDATSDAVSGAILLGRVDVPQRQRLEDLLWHPEYHSHLACFGTPSETSRAISLAAGQLLAANSRQLSGAATGGRLLYLLDGDGSLAAYAHSPWVGSCVTTVQLRTAARLVQRLLEVATTSTQTLVLCISDWGRWVTALRASPWQWAEETIAELIRFNNGDLVVAVGGGRELLTSPILAAIPNRVFLSFGASTESTMLWPRLPRFAAMAGRAAIAGPINASAAQADPETMHIAQLGTHAPGRVPGQALSERRAGSHAARTLAVAELPRTLTMAELQAACPGRHGSASHGAPAPGQLVVGLGGDGHELVSLHFGAGALIPVVGGSRTGKTAFLNALWHLNGARILPSRPQEDPAGIFLVDDAAGLEPLQQGQISTLLAAGTSIVAALSYPNPGLSRLPLEWGLRSVQQGIVLMPQRPSDAELFGVRLDTTGAEPLGRGVLIDGGLCHWFQFPFLQPPPQESIR
ncbi:FtsK/SpoIIIE domain-containing protein [Arthrobacter sp. TMN-49]